LTLLGAGAEWRGMGKGEATVLHPCTERKKKKKADITNAAFFSYLTFKIFYPFIYISE